LTAQWINGDGYDTRACQEFYRPGVTISHGLGYCASNGAPAAQPDQPLDTWMDRLWLFTVNGAVGPSLDLDAGLTRLKIVNLSSVVTYVLDLVPEGCGAGCDDAERAFQLAKVDGVVTSAANPAIASLTAKAQTREPFIKISRLLLLPASRAEILIPNSDPHADDQKYVLRTRGFETGGAGQDVTDYQGDPWPAVDLASVTLKPVASASPPANALKDLIGTGFRVRLMSQEKTNARNDMAKTAPPPVPHNCLALPDDTYRRRITLTQTASEFRIGSDIVDNKGDPAPSGGNPDPNHIAPIAFEHGAPPLSIPHVCAKLGTEEIWEVVNTTNELHNFHVHQTKFRLATAGGRTAPPSLPPGYTDAMAIEDPKNVIENQLGETGRVPSGVKNVDIWHDTLPVPPASFDTDGTMLKPGRIFVRIPFYDPHQVGTYVFHCHILEHEDKGMMEVMEVYDPLHPDTIGKAARYSPRNGAGASRFAYCGAPPTDAALIAPAPRSWAQDIAARFVRAGD
jgi:FtsP/CotA-like multicopper oxidase with cupredoxin domain